MGRRLFPWEQQGGQFSAMRGQIARAGAEFPIRVGADGLTDGAGNLHQKLRCRHKRGAISAHADPRHDGRLRPRRRASRTGSWRWRSSPCSRSGCGWSRSTTTAPTTASRPTSTAASACCCLFLLVLRFAWRLANPKPDDSELSPFERAARAVVHWGFYPLLFALMVSGYLISTADGRPIEVFDWFSVPSLVHQKGLEDTGGRGARDPRLRDDRRRRPARRGLPQAPLRRPQQHP